MNEVDHSVSIIVTGVASLATLGGILLQMGRVLQKVETLRKDLESIKEELATEIEDIHKDINKEKEVKDLWRAQVTEKLGELSERTAVIETKLHAYIKNYG